MIYIIKIYRKEVNKFTQMKKLFDLQPEFCINSQIYFTKNSSVIRLDMCIHFYNLEVNEHIENILDAFSYDRQGIEEFLFFPEVKLDLTKPLFFYEFNNLFPTKYITRKREYQLNDSYISYEILNNENKRYGFLKINKENPNDINDDPNLCIVTN